MTRHPKPPVRSRDCISAGLAAQRPRTAALTLIAAAVALALGTLSGQADALSLGRIQVLSALGEPLRAEIEVVEITAAEADGLRVNVASSEAFRTAGIPYNTSLADVRTSLQRRPDGRFVVRLTSSRGMNDPFIDLLLEANSPTSRVVRDYTLLLDPPSNRSTPASAPAAVAPTSQPLPLPTTPTVRAVPSPAPVREAASRNVPPGAARQRVTVRAGDTASRIASAHKPAEISLDQMLVAMLRTNPDAFIDGNMNRIRAGALIDLPDAAQAGMLSAPEARQTVMAQSRDFGDYRRRLADNAPASRVATSSRQASGRLQASVDDRSQAAASPDRLTVAQGRVADEQIAQARQSEQNNARIAELSKNIEELNRLQAVGGAGATAPSAPAPSTAPSIPAAVAAGAASINAAAMPAAAAAPAEPAWYVGLIDNPLFLGALSLVVLLLGWMAYRMNSRRRQDASESVFMESRLPKDSFFAGIGGETVDTKNRSSSVVSSLSYSPSQLDAGDVDPVAEADVYLAYGRDLQAEEILREALRVNPERAAIHLKLLEIHAKRRDLRAYEALAADLQKLTGGTGSDWNRVIEIGKDLDPGNPLYEAGTRSSAYLQDPQPSAPAPSPQAHPAFVPSVAPLDFDLDLDRTDAQAALDSEWITASLPTRPAPLSPDDTAQKHPTASSADRFVETMRDAPRVLPAHPPLIDLENDFNTEPGALEMPVSRNSAHEEPVTVRGDLKGDSGFIEFDMSAFSGLRNAEHADTEAGGLGGESPHAIKLSLARELQALGDIEGARSLIEEVEAESTGELRAQAKQLLAKLG